jgi:O-antigen/teichoic acid export membrane protein
MIANKSALNSKFIWTTGFYAVSIGVRFLTSVVLAHLLAPEILGIMVLAHSVRAGAELIGDIGPEQNVIRSEAGGQSGFLDTIWSMQIVRGLILSVACLCAAPLLSDYYDVQISVLLAISVAPILTSLVSPAVFLMAREMDVKERNIFELSVEIFGLVINVALAIANPSIWAPVMGVLLTLGARSAFSFILPKAKPRFHIDRSHAVEILHFGKWIMLTSAAFYGTLYIDRLFLAGYVAIGVLGVYGLARTMSDLPTALAGRIGYLIIFPTVAADTERENKAGRQALGHTRFRFLLLAGLGIATAMAWSDWVVRTIYNQHYADAAWMLALLLIGTWIAVLSAFNESAVLGAGRPRETTTANLVRVSMLAIAIPLGFYIADFPGAIIGSATAELGRYVALIRSQHRAGVSFWQQDLILTLGLSITYACWIAVRRGLGI